MDDFALYCFAADLHPAETLRVLGLIERRLAARPASRETRLYKGALLARIGLMLEDVDQSQRFLASGAGIMRATRIDRRMRPVTQLRMLYARNTTQVLLPATLMAAPEKGHGLSEIIDHPGFGQLHAPRRAVVLGMQAHLLWQQGHDWTAEQVWQLAKGLESRLSGFPDAPPQIIL